jgi:outer membrane protein assembly factor BamB/predicted RNA-binding protein with RPS1 domain
MRYSGLPEPDELVVGRIDEIEDFGVFVDLAEYEDKRGFTHISEVASGWARDVRDHVSEGQTVVAKVLEIEDDTQQIELSIKDVNDHQRKEKMQERKRSSIISREPDLANVSSPPRKPLTYERIETGAPIGSGGQGVVYQAEISGTDPPDRVALKEPRQDNRTLNETVVEAFLEEAETWEMLDDRERRKPRWKSSEHIVGVVDTGDQLPWIAMEYMDGGSLGDRLADHPDGLPTDEALWIGECICRGVELAHNYGIAHLDLKPENILFRETKEGAWDVPKLADWGVSRKLAERTGTMEALSVAYAAPEQFEPQEFGDPDMLTDIYQVGVLLYTIFTGEPPHTGTQLTVLRAVVDGKEPAAPSERRSELSAELDQIVLKAIAQEKSERYRTIGVLANELQSLRGGGGVSQSDQRGQSQNQDDEGQDAVSIPSPSEMASVLGVEDKSWPMLGGNSGRTGFRPSTRGPEGRVTELWTFEAGDLDAYLANIWSSPVVDDGTVFVGCTDGNLYALDAATGTPRWKFQTGGKVHAPAIADGTLYFGSEDETIYAVDTVDGTESWRVEAGGGTNSAPAVDDDLLFVGFDENTLAAIDLASGSEVWKYEMEGSVKSPAVRGGKVFVPSVDVKSSDHYIHALEPESGDEMWTVNPTGMPGIPAVDDTTVYFGTYHCQPGFIYAVNAVTGDIRWKKKTNDWIRSSPAVGDSQLFVGSDDENLYAMDKMSGDIEWTFTTSDGVGTSVTLSREGSVFVGDEDGRIYGIDTEGGIEQWVFRTGGAIETEVSVSNERIYVGCNDGKFYALGESCNSS